MLQIISDDNEDKNQIASQAAQQMIHKNEQYKDLESISQNIGDNILFYYSKYYKQ